MTRTITVEIEIPEDQNREHVLWGLDSATMAGHIEGYEITD